MPAQPAGVVTIAILSFLYSGYVFVVSLLGLLVLVTEGATFATALLVMLPFVLFSVVGFVVSIEMDKGWKWVWHVSVSIWVLMAVGGILNLAFFMVGYQYVLFLRVASFLFMLGPLNLYPLSMFFMPIVGVVGLWYFLQLHVKVFFGVKHAPQNTPSQAS